MLTCTVVHWLKPKEVSISLICVPRLKLAKVPVINNCALLTQVKGVNTFSAMEMLARKVYFSHFIPTLRVLILLSVHESPIVAVATCLYLISSLYTNVYVLMLEELVGK